MGEERVETNVELQHVKTGVYWGEGYSLVGDEGGAGGKIGWQEGHEVFVDGFGRGVGIFWWGGSDVAR